MEDQECLDTTQQLIESLYLGLRQSQGIDMVMLQKAFPGKFSTGFQDSLDEHCRLGQMMRKDSYYRLTVAGMILLDGIVAQLIDRIV